jgi:hypothetical protein
MTPLVGNQGIIVKTRHFYGSRVVIFDIFVEQLKLPTIYLANHEKYHKLLLRDVVTNTLLKRSVGSRWWLVKNLSQE